MKGRTWLLLAVIAVFILGCGEDSSEADNEEWQAFRDGVPSAEVLKLTMPSQEAQSNQLRFAPNAKYIAAPGNYGELYLMTAKITSDVNLGVMGMLTFLDEVLTYPPTEINDNTAVWGPARPNGLSPVEIRITITRDSENENKFSFNFEARPKDGSGEWKSWYQGENVTDGKTARHGEGEFMIDFDAVREYDPATEEEGQVKVVYNTLSQERIIGVEFIEFKGKDDENKLNATYHYKENTDFSGEFDFVTKADIHADMEGGEAYPEKEDWLVNTRWESTGAGRSDVTITNGDISSYCEWGKCLDRAVFSECWGADFKVTYSGENYYADTNDIMHSNTQGDSSKCVFEEKLYPEE